MTSVVRRRRTRASLAVPTVGAVLALAAVVACSDQGPQVGTACDGHVQLQVGRGTRPTITWQPACGVSNVIVASASDPANAEALWGATSFASSMTPPVVYGTKPAGAQESFLFAGADSLTIGAQYMVLVGPSVRGGVTDTLLFTAQAPTPP